MRSSRLLLLIALPGLAGLAAAEPAGAAAMPHPAAVIPFAALLLAIAILPLAAHRWWHRSYPWVALAAAAATALYYLVVLGRSDAIIHALDEYVTFIALVGGLALATSGLVVRIGLRGGPGTNLALLIAGALLANLIGTTGASLALVRPWLRINRGRLRPYHVVFFIIIVSNVGGALTPLGDPPLLLGFLRGIPFTTWIELNLGIWAVTLAGFLAMFLAFDLRNRAVADEPAPGPPVRIEGRRSIIALGLMLGCLFLDPHLIPWLPTLEFHGHRISFLRELLMIGIGIGAWRLTPPERLRENGFSWEPLREVAWLFLGIFVAMAPALELIREAAASGSILGVPLTPAVFYVGTGLCGGMLDNAPTFAAFLAAIEGRHGLSPAQIAASADPTVITSLSAIAAASVFFGALTYLGNAPNFLVKAVCASERDDQGRPVVATPSFGGYLLRWALPLVLPWLLLVGWLFYG